MIKCILVQTYSKRKYQVILIRCFYGEARCHDTNWCVHVDLTLWNTQFYGMHSSMGVAREATEQGMMLTLFHLSSSEITPLHDNKLGWVY